MVARKLGVAEFGKFSYFQALAFLLIPFCTLGIDQIIRNKISLFPESSSKYISTGVQIKVYSALVLTIICLSYLIFFELPVANGELLFFGFLIGLIFRSFGIIEYYFDLKLESRVNGLIRILSFLIVSALYVVALISNASLSWFAFIFSSEFLISSCLLILVYRSEAESINWKIDVKLIKEILVFSTPIFMCDIAACIFLRINQIFLGNILSSDSVGLYSAELLSI
jgi:O-antigen/teichoic acid export membrane protein